MIIPKLPILLLNPSAVSNLTNQSKSLDGAANAFCFIQPPLPQPRLLPATYDDCFQAGLQMRVGDKAEAPIYFSRDPSVGFQLPHTWEHGNCAIEIDVDPPGEGDTTTFMQMHRVALRTMMLCVKDFPRLGGRDRLGPKEVLVMFVYGRAEPSNPSLPQIGQTINRGDRGWREVL